MNADLLEHRANALASDDARTRRGRDQADGRGAEATFYLVRDGAIDDREALNVLFAIAHGLVDRAGDFLGLALTETDLALAITEYNKGRERKALAALGDLGAAIDPHHVLFVEGATALALTWGTAATIAATATAFCSAGLAGVSAATTALYWSAHTCHNL